MKKLIALLLITIFVSSVAVKLYKDFTEFNDVAISILETDDDSTQKEVEKEKNLKKDKFSLPIINFSLSGLSRTQKFYIKSFYFLSNPILIKDIIPPNAA
ncbi:MAG: hypothetical protein KA319_00540 [Ferruginibacter sp.]|nr:hypothetical protein [Ferruginibacter sp.]